MVVLAQAVRVNGSMKIAKAQAGEIWGGTAGMPMWLNLAMPAWIVGSRSRTRWCLNASIK